MRFITTTRDRSMAAKICYAIWILTALFTRERLKIFTGSLQNVWIKGLIRVDIQKMKTGQSEKIKKVIGLMKDDLGGKIMTEFVALRAKVYVYRKIDKKVEEKHCKGTKKCVLAEGLTFKDYNTRLFDVETIYREQMFFEKKKHQVYKVNKQNIALNRDDDKRLVQVDGIAALAR